MTNEEFEEWLDRIHRAELGLPQKLQPGAYYYVAHPLGKVEVRYSEEKPKDKGSDHDTE